MGEKNIISGSGEERFDYAKWRRRFFEGKSVHEINDEAVKYVNEHPFVPKKELLPVKRKESWK